jgi:type IV pilus assembly protein PilE
MPPTIRSINEQEPPVVRQRGFTLIELMIAVVIVAILASIAVPSYTDYVVRGKLAEPQSNLAALRVKFEQYFQDNRTYPTGGCVQAPTTPANTQIQVPDTQYFSYGCPISSATTYLIQASSKPGVGLGDGDDYTYTIDQANNQATTAFNGNACSATKWVTKKGSGC